MRGDSGVLEICISVTIKVPFDNRNTDLSDDEIAEQVCEYVVEERNQVAIEAKCAAIRLLDGESADGE
jgi:hypothetical protein